MVSFPPQGLGAGGLTELPDHRHTAQGDGGGIVDAAEVRTDSITTTFNDYAPARELSVVESANNTLDGPQELSWQGTLCAVNSVNNSTLSIFDVSDPLNPSELVGFSPATFSLISFGPLLYGNYIYQGDQDDNDLYIIDINDPTSPSIVQTIATGTAPANLTGNGSVGYIANRDNLQTMDISDPPTAAVVDTNSESGNRLAHTAMQGDRLAVVSRLDNVVEFFDISTSDSPSLQGTHDLGFGPARGTWNGDFFILSGGVGQGFEIIDASDPANPSTTFSTTTVDALVRNIDWDAAGDLIYGANEGGDAVTCANMSDPTAPVVEYQFVPGNADNINAVRFNAGTRFGGGLLTTVSSINDSFHIIG